MDRMEFFSQVYEVVAAIPRGKVVTYGQIAWMIGTPNRSRIYFFFPLKSLKDQIHSSFYTKEPVSLLLLPSF